MTDVTSPPPPAINPDLSSSSSPLASVVLSPAHTQPSTPLALSSSTAASSLTPTLPLFSQGLYSALLPAVEECDANIQSVFNSQQQLAENIDRVAAVLTAFQTTQRFPSLTPYTLKAQQAKKRIKKIQQQVDKINERLDELRHLIRRKEGLQRHSLVSASITQTITNILATTANNPNIATKQQPIAQPVYPILPLSSTAPNQPPTPLAAAVSTAVPAAVGASSEPSSTANVDQSSSVVPSSAPAPTATSDETAANTGVVASSSSATSSSTANMPMIVPPPTNRTQQLVDLLAWDDK